MFFLLGTILYQVVSQVNTQAISFYIKIFIVAFCIIFALLNLWDFFKARKEEFGSMKLQLPKGLKKKNQDLIKKGSDSKAGAILMFFIGMAVATGEFLCTGQIYLSSVVIMVQKGSAGVFPVALLAIYSLAFVLPLIVLMIVLYFSKKAFEASEFILDKIAWIKLISAILFVGMAVYMILT